MATIPTPPVDSENRWYCSTGGLLAAILLALTILLGSQLPLWHTDFWGHLRLGQVLLQDGFFTHEPISPFTDPGVTHLHYCWLAQVLEASVFDLGQSLAGGGDEQRLLGGVEAIRLLSVLVCTLFYGLVYLACRRRRASPGVACLGLAFTITFTLSIMLFHRPQLYGFVCLMALLAIVARRPMGWWGVVGSTFLLVLWANLHGSFVMGLFILGLLLVGLLLEWVLPTERSATDTPPQLEILQLLTVLFSATLAIAVLNPHGVKLFIYVLTFGQHPNLRSLTEWLPLTFHWGGGGHVGWLVLACVVGTSRLLARTPFTWGERLLLLTFFALPFLQQRMQAWLVLLLPWILVRLWQRIRERLIEQGVAEPSRRTLLSSGIAFALLGLALAVQPAVRWLVLGKPVSSLTSAVSDSTPWELGLRWRNEPVGTLFASETVGDFMYWALPAGSRVMMTTQAHLFPPDHWSICLRVKYLDPDWAEILERFRVEKVLLEAVEHPALVKALANDPRWRVVRLQGKASRLFLAERRLRDPDEE